MKKIFEILLILLSLIGSSLQLQAGILNCKWALSNYVDSQLLKSQDPITLKAIEDLVRRVHKSPGLRLSAEEESWLREFEKLSGNQVDMNKVIEEIRKSGKSQLHKTYLQNIGVGVGAFTGIGATGSLLLWQLRREFSNHLGLEDELNVLYGLDLAGNSIYDLRLLEGLLNCVPHVVKRQDLSRIIREKSNRITSGGHLLDMGRVEDIVGILLVSQDRITVGSILETYADYKRFWNRYRIPLCTRWGRESETKYIEIAIARMSVELERLDPSLLESLRKEVKGFVFWSGKTQPAEVLKRSQFYKEQSEFRSFYNASTKRVEVFSEMTKGVKGQPFPGFARGSSYLSAINAIADIRNINEDLNWRNLNWQYTLEDGWIPRPGVWWPDLESQHGVDSFVSHTPELTFMYAVRCVTFEEACRELMQKYNPDMFVYLQAKIEPSRPGVKYEKSKLNWREDPGAQSNWYNMSLTINDRKKLKTKDVFRFLHLVQDASKDKNLQAELLKEGKEVFKKNKGRAIEMLIKELQNNETIQENLKVLSIAERLTLEQHLQEVMDDPEKAKDYVQFIKAIKWEEWEGDLEKNYRDHLNGKSLLQKAQEIHADPEKFQTEIKKKSAEALWRLKTEAAKAFISQKWDQISDFLKSDSSESKADEKAAPATSTPPASE